MLKVNDISVARERHGDAYECVVSFQVGDMSYNTVKVKLPPDATREVVDMVIGKATETLTVVSSDIKVSGEFVEIPPIADPEFAEVDEAPRTLPETPQLKPEEAF